MKYKKILTLLLLAVSLPLHAQSEQWQVEAEASDTKVTFRGDTVDMVAPKGLSLWYKTSMKGNVVIEYDACVVGDGRLSDLNCFWMASDPKAKDPFVNLKKRGGVFNNAYALQLYYLGYGGNGNTTTRFRRYDGNTAIKPGILQEYTDAAHLLQPNHWYHIRLEQVDGKVRYYIDGQCLVDYYDAQPLTRGWFAFRTTQSHTRLAHFRYTAINPTASPVTLKWIKEGTQGYGIDVPSTFGVPFEQGRVKANTPMMLAVGDNRLVQPESWPLAYWPDGSIKWMGVSAVVPAGSDSCLLAVGNEQIKKLSVSKKKTGTSQITKKETTSQYIINTGKITFYVPKGGTENLIDSIVVNGKRVGGSTTLAAALQEEKDNARYTTSLTSKVKSVAVEHDGPYRLVLKLDGVHTPGDCLPFVIRLCCYAGSDEIKVVYTQIIDGRYDTRQISALGLRMRVPMREAAYNRHVAFSMGDAGVWSESVQPLESRRLVEMPQAYRDTYVDKLSSEAQTDAEFYQVAGLKLPEISAFSEKSQELISHLAQWDEYRLSQLSPGACSIRKKAISSAPWIGTKEAHRSEGVLFVGDVTGGMILGMKDFWQSFPSTLQIKEARSNEALAQMWLWSPEAEAMNLCHYDSIAHDLNASYEDVQPGMSTPEGIARTTVLTLKASDGYTGKEDFAQVAASFGDARQLICTPEYLHRCKAFGIWSLPTRNTPLSALIEDRIEGLMKFYENEIDRCGWYGYWNYGDFMHTYDEARNEWRYDVGGYAWDNTELGTTNMLWYAFLRSGRADYWKMAEAMTRHTSEVDVYHQGPHAMLGSRHNVVHWGCGAKESRISQAAWNRFYYYLTADERTGQLMEDVKDADQMLYTLDPMRLAEPRSLYPCTKPARLRIGPDWLAYAGNWMTHWERTQDTKYRDKILAGMKSICALPHRMFSGPLALGYDPATGIITSECDTALQTTNHLMTIMGGFELMNEMMVMIPDTAWQAAWLEHANLYKEKAQSILHNRFLVPHLSAYAGWKMPSATKRKEAWTDLLHIDKKGTPAVFNKPNDPLYFNDKLRSTNDAATWVIDAIYMMETLGTATTE
jgi:hypothetical protein